MIPDPGRFPAPPNSKADLRADPLTGQLALIYNLHEIMKCRADISSNANLQIDSTVDNGISASGLEQITQRISLSSDVPIHLELEIASSVEGFPCEIGLRAQERFPLIRNTVGSPSRSLRNDAVYDRRFDWVLSVSSDGCDTRIEPLETGDTGNKFRIEISGRSIEIIFRPHYYRAHKNLPYFEPWNYAVRRDSICGWCSWWPYRREIDEQTVEAVCDLFEKKLRSYGFEYIQIDDGYQGGDGGMPEDWLNTNPERFPGGLAHLAEIIRLRKLRPALWLSVHFRDSDVVYTHRDWFVSSMDGNPHIGRHVAYGIDGSVPEAVDAILRPVYRTLRQQGWDYIKVDTLRHLLYDSYYENREYFERKGVVAEVAFREVLNVIREELGREVYILACWGVLPEVARIADGCRLGTDGFGPRTMIQFNSWNNVVWRNDPDHMDVGPDGEEWIRPVTVTMAGAQMLLTDKVEVYADDRKIEGARRCSPVLFTLPGQLYDYDPSKSENMRIGHRVPDPNGKGSARTTDAYQDGAFCEWWLMEINRDFNRWHVLARMDYRELPETEVAFTDLGLPDDREYLVFEYRSEKLLGSFRGSFTARAQESREVCIYAIRENLGRPLLLATNRHVTCGGPDIEAFSFEGGVLSGRSRVVGSDPYRVYLYMPAGTEMVSVRAEDARVLEYRTDGQTAMFELMAEESGVVEWAVDTKS